MVRVALSLAVFSHGDGRRASGVRGLQGRAARLVPTVWTGDLLMWRSRRAGFQGGGGAARELYSARNVESSGIPNTHKSFSVATSDLAVRCTPRKSKCVCACAVNAASCLVQDWEATGVWPFGAFPCVVIKGFRFLHRMRIGPSIPGVAVDVSEREPGTTILGYTYSPSLSTVVAGPLNAATSNFNALASPKSLSSVAASTQRRRSRWAAWAPVAYHTRVFSSCKERGARRG